ncbi:hypothetical protein, partial [Thermofilum sp.]|uniref:hypothetical protein n=1 Tax=Thermofilum sp. TaxID=1961369 RepID=UPI00258AB1E9
MDKTPNSMAFPSLDAGPRKTVLKNVDYYCCFAGLCGTELVVWNGRDFDPERLFPEPRPKQDEPRQPG